MVNIRINKKIIKKEILIKAIKEMKISGYTRKNNSQLMNLIYNNIKKKKSSDIKKGLKILGIKGYSRLNKNQLISIFNDIYELNFKKTEDTNIIKKILLNKLRERRVIKKDKGIIIQNPPIYIHETISSFGDISKDKYISAFNDSFYEIINDAKNNIFKNKQIFSDIGSLNILYGIPGARGGLEFRWTSNFYINDNGFKIPKDESLGFFKDKEITPNDVRKVLTLDSSGIPYLFLGYKIILRLNGEMSNITVNNLKAYKPSTDRKYHELTTASTSTNKLCIYESFLDIIGKRKLIYKRDKNNIEDLKKMLNNEGEEIKNNIKNGNLIKSLILLTKKYDTEILISYYDGDENDKEILIVKGYEITNFNINDYIDKKCMLYEKNIHVAPAVYKKKEIKKLDKKENKFILKPEFLKDNKFKIRNVYGFDAETYRNEKLECIGYCICLYGRSEDDKEFKKYFYGINAIDEFIDYIDNLSDKSYYYKSRPKDKIPKIYIYGFNNARFDNLLIYEKLYNKNPKTKYQFGNTCIKYIKYNNIIINDISLFYKSGTLRDTCKDFKLEKEKGVFPYDFVNKDNLYYKGDVPELKYWNNESEYKEYIEKNGNIFNMEQYTIKYCMLDSELVYLLGKLHFKLCIGEINNRKYNLITCPTAAKLSMKMFQQCFLKEKLEQSTDIQIYKEKLAYKGGRTEKFKESFETNDDKRLYYYDINSSYPSSMLKLMPYKFIDCNLVNNKIINKKNVNFIIPYYLYKAKFRYYGNDDNYISNLLLRYEKTNEIISIKESDTATYHWGCELIEAIKDNNEIIITEENRYEGLDVFKQFSIFFYNERLKAKKESNYALIMFYKLLLNSLYGKFGQKQFNKSCLCKTNEEVFKLLKKENGILVNFQLINDNIMIEYKTKINEHNSVGKLVRFASYITAESRCNLAILMRDVGHENIYYCDTDSVFTIKKPNDNLIDQSELGKWKQETKTPIIKACFIAPKTYTYLCEDGKTQNKCKGFSGDKIDSQKYYDLNNGKIDNIKQTTKMFFRTYENIKIDNQERTMIKISNKRIWDGNNSKSFKNIEEWIKNKN